MVPNHKKQHRRKRSSTSYSTIIAAASREDATNVAVSELPPPPAPSPPPPSGRQERQESSTTTASSRSSLRSIPMEYSDTSVSAADEQEMRNRRPYYYNNDDDDDEDPRGGGAFRRQRRQQHHYQNQQYHQGSLLGTRPAALAASNSSPSPSPPTSPTLSQFRMLNDSITQSMRVVRLTSSQSAENLGDEENQQQQYQQARGGGGGGGRHMHSTSPTPDSNNWATNFALSFRSPHIGHHKTLSIPKDHELLNNNNKETPAPHHHSYEHHAEEPSGRSEEWTPLLLLNGKKRHSTIAEEHDSALNDDFAHNKGAGPISPSCQDYVGIAAAFLKDYESNRPPSLSGNLLSITDRQLKLHQFKFSKFFTCLLWLAVACLFVSSGMEGCVTVVQLSHQNNNTHSNSSSLSNTMAMTSSLSNEKMGAVSSASSTTAAASTVQNTTAAPFAYNTSPSAYTDVDEGGDVDNNTGEEETETTVATSPTKTFYPHDRRILLTALNVFALLVFAIDFLIRHELRTESVTATSTKDAGGGRRSLSSFLWGRTSTTSTSASLYYRHPSVLANVAGMLSTERHINLTTSMRPSRSQRIIKPLILFGTLLACENLSRVILTQSDSSLVLLTSVFKPLIIFYVSYQARNAFEALTRIIRIVVRVIFMELLLILMFAAVAVRLFQHISPEFESLSGSWLSLFELSTTVVNPSLWMPMYEHSHSSAGFFILFVVVSTFYLHSLVLSVVFQTYIHAASELHERSAADREDAVHLAYLALVMQQVQIDQQCQGQNGAIGGNKMNSLNHHQHHNVVEMPLVRQLLELMRPHYSPLKINALVDIVESSASKTNASLCGLHDNTDGATEGVPTVDYPTFRTKIRQALNASIRTPRSATSIAMTIEFLAIFVAIINFIYVILVSSKFTEAWFDAWQEVIGSIITVVAAFELLVRFNPCRVADFTPLTRLDTTFDGLALLGAIVSGVGIVLRLNGTQFVGFGALDLILTGRAIDMIRIMRFFRVFRDVVRRSADVLPALSGPAVLVVSALHLFVYAGMALWGGAVRVGQQSDKITPLYDLNNFNSYQEGMVTMFQVLVVNDWHEIARVFLYADRCSSPLIVYPFFVTAILICVSILLNVLTAFFVESVSLT